MRAASMTRLVFALPLLGAAATGCHHAGAATFGPTKVDIPASDGARSVANANAHVLQGAPPSASGRDAVFPVVARSKLANGMSLAVVPAHALPIVQVRVLVRAGSGYGAPMGVATLTGDMLKDGGTRALPSAELLRRIETLGADLSIGTDFDGTVLAMAVTKDQLPEGLALLSQVIREPRFDEGELRKLKARDVDESQDAARSSGNWAAMRVIFKELFPEKSAYVTYGLLPSEIARIDSGAVREFHRRFYVPKATTLVLAGDVDEAAARSLAERSFGSWTGGEPPKVDFAPPHLPPKTRVVIAHRPKSVQSDVYVTMLAPNRSSEGWAAVRVANQVLGGGVASRLFTDVREQRSLAYHTSADLLELAHGPQPLVAYAGTQTDKTAQAVIGLLENLERMTSTPPTVAEVEGARRYVSDVFAIRMETVGSIADLVVTEDSLGLPDGYWEAYRKQIRAADPPLVAAAAKKLYTVQDALIVVAGDADVIAPELARFGEVTVVDPEKEFKTMKTLPQGSK